MRAVVVSYVMIWLMVSMPLVSSQLVRIPENELQKVEKSIENTFSTQEPTLRNLIGEDIALQVDSYQPAVVPAQLIEDQGATVFVLLKGTLTNPTITIPKITSVTSVPVSIKTRPEGLAAPQILPPRHYPPRGEGFSSENMGYLEVRIGRIPREEDVPEEIIIDMQSRINFDVSRGLTFGPQEMVLTQKSYDEWILTKEDNHFFGGYIRAESIEPDKATFTIYDKALNEVHTVVVKSGSTSSTINAYRPGMSLFSPLFDRFAIAVKEVRAEATKAIMFVTRDGRTEQKILTVGQPLFSGSSWYIDEVSVTPEGERIVRLKSIGGKLGTMKLAGNQGKPREISDTTGTEVQPPGQKVQDSLYNKLLAQYDSACETLSKKEDVEKCHTEIVLPAIQQIRGQTTTEFTKSLMRNILFKVFRAYESYATTLFEKQGTPEVQAEKEDLVKKINELQLVLSEKRVSSIEEGAIKTVNLNFEQAVGKAKQSYQELLDSYPGSNQSVDALYRIGWINLFYERNPFLAQQAFEKIKASQKYPQGVTERELETLLQLTSASTNVLAFQAQSEEVLEEDGSVTGLILFDVMQPTTDQQATAKIKVGNLIFDYRQGSPLEQVGQSTAGMITWAVGSIKDSSVELVGTAQGGKGDVVQRRASVSVGKQTMLHRTINDEKDTFPVELFKTNLKREVYIVLVPASEKAFSESFYTIRIPIEKRPFDLPLFSSSIDNEIKKTEELIAKLDSLIVKISEIHKYWITFCFATQAVLTAKNLLFGGKSAIAREKVNEIYRQRYSNHQLDNENCKSGVNSFEECVFSNIDDYQKDLSLVEQAMNEADSKLSTVYPELKEDSYLDDRRDLYIKKKIAEAHPSDEVYAADYYAKSLELKEKQVNAQLFTAFHDGNKERPFTEIQSVGSHNVREEIKTIIQQSYLRLDPLATDTDFAEVFNTNRGEILSAYKAEYERQELERFFVEEAQNPTIQVSALPKLKDRTIRRYVPAEINPIRVSYDENTKRYALTLPNLEPRDITEEMEQIGMNEEKFKSAEYDLTIDGQRLHVSPKAQEEKPQYKLSTAPAGRAKGKVQQLAVNSRLYIENEYSDSGRIEKQLVFERPEANGQLGAGSDVRLGELNDVIAAFKKRGDPEALNAYKTLAAGKACVDTLNRNIGSKSYRSGDLIGHCSNLGTFVNAPAQQPTTTECIDFMSPGECKMMYNACDPVICPTSRCDFGGEWPVENVVQTGLVGSVALCSPNWVVTGGDVVMPVCITGVIASLNNLNSILKGYRQCLITAKVEGQSIGLCDELRSFGICDMLWREGIALFNVKGGILGNVLRGVFGGDAKGGGEYSSFDKAVDNSIGYTEYFTQSYAKNVFAQYSGKALPELGGEICKAAVYGKAPFLGDLFQQVTRPESPPQFTAFFEEAPFTDVTTRPLSIYNSFYQVYAGENQDIRFSVYLQSRNLQGDHILPPVYITCPNVGMVRNRPLEAKRFDIQSCSQQLPSGYDQICIEIVSPNYGVQTACGSGKVSSSYFLNMLNDKYIESEALKQIDSEEECQPETGRITTFEATSQGVTGGLPQYPYEGFPGSGAVGVGAGALNRGLLQTGIIRKCERFDPDVGTTNENWQEIGTCGKDDRGRDLGICWLYRPSALNQIKNLADQQALSGDLNQKVQQVQQQLGADIAPIYDAVEIQKRIDTANKLITDAKTQGIDVAKDKLGGAVTALNEILSSGFVEQELAAKALFVRGDAYQTLAEKIRATTLQQDDAPPAPPAQPPKEKCELELYFAAPPIPNVNRHCNERIESVSTNQPHVDLCVESKNAECPNADVTLNIKKDNQQDSLATYSFETSTTFNPALVNMGGIINQQGTGYYSFSADLVDLIKSKKLNVNDKAVFTLVSKNQESYKPVYISKQLTLTA